MKKRCKRKSKMLLNDNESVFDYTLVLKPCGTVMVLDEKGNLIKPTYKRRCPPIKKVLNVRQLTIVEAKGSRWAYIDPPGTWWNV
jgi:hypothetical protein